MRFLEEGGDEGHFISPSTSMVVEGPWRVAGVS